MLLMMLCGCCHQAIAARLTQAGGRSWPFASCLPSLLLPASLLLLLLLQ
jgi:hypothetical protein